MFNKDNIFIFRQNEFSNRKFQSVSYQIIEKDFRLGKCYVTWKFLFDQKINSKMDVFFKEEWP